MTEDITHIEPYLSTISGCYDSVSGIAASGTFADNVRRTLSSIVADQGKAMAKEVLRLNGMDPDATGSLSEEFDEAMEDLWFVSADFIHDGWTEDVETVLERATPGQVSDIEHRSDKTESTYMRIRAGDRERFRSYGSMTNSGWSAMIVSAMEAFSADFCGLAGIVEDILEGLGTHRGSDWDHIYEWIAECRLRSPEWMQWSRPEIAAEVADLIESRKFSLVADPIVEGGIIAVFDDGTNYVGIFEGHKESDGAYVLCLDSDLDQLATDIRALETKELKTAGDVLSNVHRHKTKWTNLIWGGADFMKSNVYGDRRRV